MYDVVCGELARGVPVEAPDLHVPNDTADDFLPVYGQPYSECRRVD